MEENTQVLYNYDEILDRILSVESEKQKIEKRLSESETLRKRFVETYTIEKLENLPLEEYVLGHSTLFVRFLFICLKTYLLKNTFSDLNHRTTQKISIFV